MSELGRRRVLIIDDDQQIAGMMAAVFRQAGYAVRVAYGGTTGLKIAQAERQDAIVTDIIMAEGEGVETIIALRKIDAEVKIVAISGGGRVGARDFLELARAVGADATLSKPFRPTTLLEEVDALLSASDKLESFAQPSLASVG